MGEGVFITEGTGKEGRNAGDDLIMTDSLRKNHYKFL